MAFRARRMAGGLREVGSRLQDFGLQMLQAGLSEKKALEAQQALTEYEDFLRTKMNIPEEQIDAELQKATDEVISSAAEGAMGEARERRIEAPAPERPGVGLPGEAPRGIGLQALQGVSPERRAEMLRRADVVSEEVAPGQVLAEGERPGVRRVGVPLAEQLGMFESRLATPEIAAAREAAVKRGVTPEQMRLAEERMRAGIVRRGEARILEEERKFKRAATKKELELREIDIERKRAYGEERNQIAEQKARFDRLAKTRAWQLDKDELDWKKTVKREYQNITQANRAAQKVRELRQIIKDGEEGLRWNREYFDIKEKKRGTGLWNAVADVIDPVEQKEYNEKGQALRNRLNFYQQTMDALIKKFNLTPDMIREAGGFEGPAGLQSFQK